MSSYVLSLLISAFLSTITAESHKSVGHAFIDFLKYYGTIYDPNTMMISQDIISCMPIEQISSEMHNILYVSDPFRPEWNAAASVTRFCEIQDCFRQVYEKLIEIEGNWEAIMKNETGKYTKGILQNLFEV